MVGKRQEQQTTGISLRRRQSLPLAAQLRLEACQAVSSRRHLVTPMMTGASPILMGLLPARCSSLLHRAAGRRVMQRPGLLHRRQPPLSGKRRLLPHQWVAQAEARQRLRAGERICVRCPG